MPIADKFRSVEEDLSMAIFPQPKISPEFHEPLYTPPFVPYKAFDLSWERILLHGYCSEQTAKPCLLGFYNNLRQRKTIYEYLSQLTSLSDKIEYFAVWRGDITPECKRKFALRGPNYILLNTRRRKTMDFGWQRGSVAWNKLLEGSSATVSKKSGDLRSFMEAILLGIDKSKFLQSLERDFTGVFKECYLSLSVQLSKHSK